MADERAVITGAGGPAAETDSPFSVTVAEIYDGPLDLLLDLIRKQNINIYDIPIAQITGQFLQYTERMKNMDVDVAAEFIYMASTLIVLKSRMLLPRDPERAKAEDGTDEDPRDELVRRLLEHERFKSAAQMLLQKQQIEEAIVTNPAVRLFKQDAPAERELDVGPLYTGVGESLAHRMNALIEPGHVGMASEGVNAGADYMYVRHDSSLGKARRDERRR